MSLSIAEHYQTIRQDIFGLQHTLDWFDRSANETVEAYTARIQAAFGPNVSPVMDEFTGEMIPGALKFSGNPEKDTPEHSVAMTACTHHNELSGLYAYEQFMDDWRNGVRPDGTVYLCMGGEVSQVRKCLNFIEEHDTLTRQNEEDFYDLRAYEGKNYNRIPTEMHGRLERLMTELDEAKAARQVAGEQGLSAAQQGFFREQLQAIREELGPHAYRALLLEHNILGRTDGKVMDFHTISQDSPDGLVIMSGPADLDISQQYEDKVRASVDDFARQTGSAFVLLDMMIAMDGDGIAGYPRGNHQETHQRFAYEGGGPHLSHTTFEGCARALRVFINQSLYHGVDEPLYELPAIENGIEPGYYGNTRPLFHPAKQMAESYGQFAEMDAITIPLADWAALSIPDTTDDIAMAAFQDQMLTLKTRQPDYLEQVATQDFWLIHGPEVDIGNARTMEVFERIKDMSAAKGIPIEDKPNIRGDMISRIGPFQAMRAGEVLSVSDDGQFVTILPYDAFLEMGPASPRIRAGQTEAVFFPAHWCPERADELSALAPVHYADTPEQTAAERYLIEGGIEAAYAGDMRQAG